MGALLSTLGLTGSRRRVRPSPLVLLVEAITRERNDVNGTFDLLLWVDDGWLDGVEIVDYVDRHGDESPEEIPT